MSAVLVLVELAGGAPDRLSAEALGVAGGIAKAIGGEVHAVVIASSSDADGAAAAAPALGGYGVTAVHLVADAGLAAYAPAAWAAAVTQVATAGSYAAIVASGGERATEVLAHVAARIDVPMAANVVSVQPGDRWRLTRQRWAGSLLEEAFLDGQPHLLTVAAHAVPALEQAASAKPATVTRVDPAITDADLRARVVGHDVTAGDSVSLADAKVVVGGGRGLGSAEAFAMLDELAGLLGAAVGRVAGGDEPRLATACPADRSDRDPDRTGPVHRLRHQRRDPAHRRREGGQADPRDQHRPGRPDLPPRELRGHRRRQRRRARHQRGDPAGPRWWVTDGLALHSRPTARNRPALKGG